MTRKHGSSQRGFTLIEVVVSMMLLAILSVMAYQGLEQVLRANDRSLDASESDAALQRTWLIIGQDLIHLRPRSIRDPRGGVEPAYMTRTDNEVVTFSRGGGPMLWQNPSGLQRITYGVNAKKQLVRRAEPATTLPGEEQSFSRVLLDQVGEVEFLQLNSRNEFEPNWPPLNETVSATSLPRMIRVRIRLLNGTETFRIFPGVEAGG